jgi:hypothetical protein
LTMNDLTATAKLAIATRVSGGPIKDF